ncbi:hypothetical protein FA10DRAFT_265810 [Acaromyces ingoldii]|uniref:Uncharacterized protein n=1 Tax=Acaromyces ingoldii TaxID=215250 RepID=A0A316YR22_9BASI|nr:hypothetical protein FA10DRAFT_265810 [Acaromyces ingoldii]PWN92000.1 hypothetical protein FA10DRAFT_265810 [Acaromyces ingoldii]
MASAASSRASSRSSSPPAMIASLPELRPQASRRGSGSSIKLLTLQTRGNPTLTLSLGQPHLSVTLTYAALLQYLAIGLCLRTILHAGLSALWEHPVTLLVLVASGATVEARAKAEHLGLRKTSLGGCVLLVILAAWAWWMVVTGKSDAAGGASTVDTGSSSSWRWHSPGATLAPAVSDGSSLHAHTGARPSDKLNHDAEASSVGRLIDDAFERHCRPRRSSEHPGSGETEAQGAWISILEADGSCWSEMLVHASAQGTGTGTGARAVGKAGEQEEEEKRMRRRKVAATAASALLGEVGEEGEGETTPTSLRHLCDEAARVSSIRISFPRDIEEQDESSLRRPSSLVVVC